MEELETREIMLDENIPSVTVTKEKELIIPHGSHTSFDQVSGKARSVDLSYSDGEDTDTSSDTISSTESVILTGVDSVVEYSEEYGESYCPISHRSIFIPHNVSKKLTRYFHLDPYEHEYSNIEVVVEPPVIYECPESFHSLCMKLRHDYGKDNWDCSPSIVSDEKLISLPMDQTEAEESKETEEAESSALIPINSNFIEKSTPNSRLENDDSSNLETEDTSLVEDRCDDNIEAKSDISAMDSTEAANDESLDQLPFQEVDCDYNSSESRSALQSLDTNSSLFKNNLSDESEQEFKTFVLNVNFSLGSKLSFDSYFFDFNSNQIMFKKVYNEETLAAAFNGNMAKIWRNPKQKIQQNNPSLRRKETPLLSALSGLFRHRSSWQPTTRLMSRGKNVRNKVWSVAPDDSKVWNLRATGKPCGCPPCFGYSVSPMVFGNPFNLPWKNCEETSIHLGCYDNVSKNDDELDLGTQRIHSNFESEENCQDDILSDEMDVLDSELTGTENSEESPNYNEGEKFLWYKKCMEEVVSDIRRLTLDFYQKETELNNLDHVDSPFEQKICLPYLVAAQENYHPDLSIGCDIPFPRIDHRMQYNEDISMKPQMLLQDSCTRWPQESIESDCDSCYYSKEASLYSFSSYDNLKLGQESSNTDPNSILGELDHSTDAFADNTLTTSDKADYYVTVAKNSLSRAECTDEDFIDLSINVLSRSHANYDGQFSQSSIDSNSMNEVTHFTVPSLDPNYTISAFVLRRNTIDDPNPHYFYKLYGDEFPPDDYFPSGDVYFSDDKIPTSSMEVDCVDSTTSHSKGRTSPCPSICSSITSSTWYTAEDASFCPSQNSANTWCSADSTCASQEIIHYRPKTAALPKEEQEKDYWTPLPVFPSTIQHKSQKMSSSTQRRSNRIGKKVYERAERNRSEQEKRPGQPYLFRWTKEGLQNHYGTGALPVPMNSFLLESEADFPTLEQSKSFKNASKKLHVPP